MTVSLPTSLRGRLRALVEISLRRGVCVVNPRRLAAAIPAVVIYNVFARSIGGYRILLGDTAAEFLRLVSRDLDRGTSMRARVPAAAE